MTGEFVVNLTPEPLTEQINQTSGPYPPERSEFDEAGLSREPSALVRPPRVAAPMGKLGRDDWGHPGRVSKRPRPTAAEVTAG